MCRLSFRLLIVPSVFLCPRFRFVLVCAFVWLGDLTAYLFPFSWCCTQIASKVTPLLPPGSAFRRFKHASSTTVFMLSLSLFRCCLSLRFRELFSLPRFHVLQFDQGPCASLLGLITAPVLPLHLIVLVLYRFAFRPMVPRQPSRLNLADPDVIQAVFFVFYNFRLFLVCLSTNGPTLAYFFASWLFLIHRPTDGPTSAFHVQRSGL